MYLQTAVLYNAHYGGVDTFDQMRSYYTTDQEGTRKWPTKVFFFVLDTAACNSYFLCKTYESPQLLSRRVSAGKVAIDRRRFQRALAIGLVCRGKGWDLDEFESKWRGNTVPDAPAGSRCFPEAIPGGRRLRCTICGGGQSSFRCGLCKTTACVLGGKECFKTHVEER